MADLRLQNDEKMYAHFEALLEGIAQQGLVTYAVEHNGDTYTCLGVQLADDDRETFDAVPIALFLTPEAWEASSIVDAYAAKERPDGS